MWSNVLRLIRLQLNSTPDLSCIDEVARNNSVYRRGNFRVHMFLISRVIAHVSFVYDVVAFSDMDISMRLPGGI